MKNILISLLAMASLSACASVASGSDQEIFVSTTPVTGASCKLTSASGSWLIDSTPEKATIKRDNADLTVKCTKGALKGEARVVSGVEDVAFGNILAGGVIGVMVDRSAGAAFNYPEEVSVPISKEGSSNVIAPPPPPKQEQSTRRHQQK